MKMLSTDQPAGRPAAGNARPGRKRNRVAVLVVVDETEASARALAYVARWVAGRRDASVHLARVSPRLPARLLETGGAERAEREERIEADLRGEQRRWTETSDRRAEPVLDAARDRLEREGIAAGQIHMITSSPLDIRSTADEVLLLARDLQCGTIVVGHHAHGWVRELGGGDLAEQLVRRADGRGIWVID
jgi:nucleotide-binding universal stress UspA family protein